MQVLTALGGTTHPVVIVVHTSPFSPYFVEGGDVVAGVGETLSEAIGGEGDETCFRINEIRHGAALILNRTIAHIMGRRGVLDSLRTDGDKDILCLFQIVDARIVAPTVGGEDKGGDEIEFTVAGSSLGIVGTVGLTTPGEVASIFAKLVLHVGLAPAPQTVEDVLLAKLYGNHHAVGHALGADIVVLDIGDVAHVVAYLEVDFVRAAEHIVEHLLELCVDIGLLVAHLDKEVTVLARLKAAFLPRGERQGVDSQHQ